MIGMTQLIWINSLTCRLWNTKKGEKKSAQHLALHLISATAIVLFLVMDHLVLSRKKNSESLFRSSSKGFFNKGVIQRIFWQNNDVRGIHVELWAELTNRNQRGRRAFHVYSKLTFWCNHLLLTASVWLWNSCKVSHLLMNHRSKWSSSKRPQFRRIPTSSCRLFAGKIAIRYYAFDSMFVWIDFEILNEKNTKNKGQSMQCAACL